MKRPMTALVASHCPAWSGATDVQTGLTEHAWSARVVEQAALIGRLCHMDCHALIATGHDAAKNRRYKLNTLQAWARGGLDLAIEVHFDVLAGARGATAGYWDDSVWARQVATELRNAVARAHPTGARRQMIRYPDARYPRDWWCRSVREIQGVTPILLECATIPADGAWLASPGCEMRIARQIIEGLQSARQIQLHTAVDRRPEG